MNYSNGIYYSLATRRSTYKPYKYYVSKGNNGALVQQVFRK